MFILCTERDLIVNNEAADQWKEVLSGIAQDVDNSSVTELLLALIWECRVLQHCTLNDLFHPAVKQNILHKCNSSSCTLGVFDSTYLIFFFKKAPLDLVQKNGVKLSRRKWRRQYPNTPVCQESWHFSQEEGAADSCNTLTDPARTQSCFNTHSQGLFPIKSLDFLTHPAGNQ